MTCEGCIPRPDALCVPHTCPLLFTATYLYMLCVCVCVCVCGTCTFYVCVCDMHVCACEYVNWLGGKGKKWGKVSSGMS